MKTICLNYDPSSLQYLYEDLDLPVFTHYNRRIKYRTIKNVGEELESQLIRKFDSALLPGMSVAVAVGSRGIDQINVVVKVAVDYLKKRLAKPYIVAAMGSHGGATSEGQKHILSEYGITEETMGVEILTSMEVEDISSPGDPIQAFIAKDALKADKILLINRIKPHTDFSGKHESGLMKLIAIGLGKHKGALTCHSQGYTKMPSNIEMIANRLFNSGKILGGVGIVENELHQICKIEAICSHDIPERDAKLLKVAKKTIGLLPFKQLDALIVSRCGKEISGAGMDPNVTGKGSNSRNIKCRINYLVCSDLTDKSYGNAIGAGNADIICERILEKVDLKATYINGITSRGLSGAKIPLIAGNDEEAIKICMLLCDKSPETIRIACIRDTNSTNSIYISPALIQEADEIPELIRQNDTLDFHQGYIQL